MMKIARLMALCLVPVLPIAAVQPMRVPAVELTALDGLPKMADKLGLNGAWLLVVLQPGCRSCDSLLQLVKKREDHPNLAPRMVIVGVMSLAELRKLALRYPNLSGARWYADPSRQLSRQLQFSGVPVMAGVRGQIVTWTQNGLGNATRTRSMMLSWTK